MTIPLPPLPEPDCPGVHFDGYSATEVRAIQREAMRVAIEAAAQLNWVDIMREGQLVTWGDAGTLGYRVVESLRALEIGT